jgi:hypothetical protein
MPEIVTELPGEAMIIGIAIVIILMLLAMNIFFIRRLVTKLEDVPLLSQRVGAMETTIRNLTNDLKDIGDLREKVAVLNYALEELKKKKD